MVWTGKLAMHSLAYTTEMALCPFRTDVCSIFGTDRVAFVMDTGNISFSQLGLNTKFSKGCLLADVPSARQ
jgi:hypothetical protein